MSFLIEDDKVWDRYDETWCVIKDEIGIKFQSEPVSEYKYLKAKVREYDGVIKTNFLVNDRPKKKICIVFALLASLLILLWILIIKITHKFI